MYRECGRPQESHCLCYERCVVSCHACLIKLSSSKRHFARYCSWNDDERHHLRGRGYDRHLRRNSCLPLASLVLPVVHQTSRDARRGTFKTVLDTELRVVCMWDICSPTVKGKSSPASGFGNLGSHHLDNQVYLLLFFSASVTAARLGQGLVSCTPQLFVGRNRIWPFNKRKCHVVKPLDTSGLRIIMVNISWMCTCLILGTGTLQGKPYCTAVQYKLTNTWLHNAAKIIFILPAEQRVK